MRLFGLLGLGIILAFAGFSGQRAHAYCVKNQGSNWIVAAQLPITSRSFKKAIGPGKTKCCNWSTWDCTSKTYGGVANRFGYTPFVIGRYSSSSKAKKKKDDLQIGGVFSDIGKTMTVAAGIYKGCFKCSKKAIEAVNTMSNGILGAASHCSGLLQNGAGLGVTASGKCTSWDLKPKSPGLFPVPGKTKYPRQLSDDVHEIYIKENVPMPKINGDKFMWLPFLK